MTGSFSADDAEAVLVRDGVPVVRLFGTSEAGNRLLLVRPEAVTRAEHALAGTPWRYRASGHRWPRFIHHSVFAWDGGATVSLVSGVPAGPVPSRALAALEDRIWRNARDTASEVREPDSVEKALVAAVQIVRPGFPRPVWRREFARLSHLNDPEVEEEAAREVGVARSLSMARRALGLEAVADEPRAELYEHVWRAGRFLQRRTRSRRLRALLDGAPIPGHVVFRTRFGGVEVDSGHGVFLPVAFSEELIDAALERLVASSKPVILEIGTGCGAIAVALASARPDAEVHATDISARALRWAWRNARRLGLGNVHFYRGTLLEPVPSTLHRRVNVVLTNVPYAPPSYRRPNWDDMPETVEGEGDDGLGLPRSLAVGVRRVLSNSGWLIAQIATEQVDAFRSELHTLGYQHHTVAVRAGDAVVAAQFTSPS